MAINQQRAKERGKEAFKREPERDEFVPDEGKEYTIRPLPRDMEEYLSPEGADDFAYVYRYHFSYVKSDGTKLWNIMCPKTWGNDKPCEICRENQELYNSPNEEDKKLAKKFYRQERALLNIIDLSDSNGVAKGVQWFRAPIQKVYEAIRKLVINPAWTINGKDILDLVSGRNFTMRVVGAKESSTGYTDYEITPSPVSFDITPYLVGDWQERIASLVTHKPRTTNDDIIKLIAVKASRGAAPAANKTAPPPGAVPPPPGSVGQAAPPAPPVQAAPPAPPVQAAPPDPPVQAAPLAIGGTYITPPSVLPVQEAPPIQAAQAAQPPAAAQATGEVPECFGKKYAPRTPECIACKANTPKMLQDCRKKFLDA